MKAACYLLKCAEENGRAWGDPWSIRRTGLYHHIDPDTRSNIVILLHPVPKSKAQERIRAFVSLKGSQSIAVHPLSVQLLLLSTYLTHWRAYLRDLGREFVSMVRKSRVPTSFSR